jgi:prenyltransferase beta subunit
MVTRRQFLARAGSVALCGGLSAKLAIGAFPDDDALPDGRQSLNMINERAQEAINRGLAYLNGQQHEDGSYGTLNHHGNVAITSLCGIAFLAGGHQSGRGRYGRAVNRIIEFLVALEERNTRSGLPAGFLYNSAAMQNGPMYGHGFGTLFLAETYGMVHQPALRRRLRDTLSRAVQLIINTQNPEGGWRYRPERGEADISVTICQIMALRAARNAGFYVPDEIASKCVQYVERCQDINGDGGFRYQQQRFGHTGFARTAAGVVALNSAGVYKGRAVDRGLEYLMQRCKPGQQVQGHKWQQQEALVHYYYGHYYAVQAMWIRGGDYWAEWYPAIRDDLLNHPDRNAEEGSWHDRRTFPHCPHYCTAMALIILQVPNNYLPIFQR